MPDISILIVNYNTKDLVCACIDSILQQKDIHAEIIVVDNASQDNSVNVLHEKYSSQIHLIQSETNLGFGRANNLAAEKAQGEYLYLINPDAILTTSDALSKLLTYARARPMLGLIGTAIDEPRKKKHTVKPRHHYPAEKMLKYTRGLENLPGKITWVLGASMLITRAIFEQVKGFDSDFFLYGEETDLCLRIRKVGYEIAYYHEVQVRHVSGASEQSATAKETWLRKQRGFYLFCQKHYDPRDVKNIAKKSLLRGYFKLFLLKLKSFLGHEIAAKQQRLEANIEVARAVIASKATQSRF